MSLIAICGYRSVFVNDKPMSFELLPDGPLLDFVIAVGPFI